MLRDSTADTNVAFLKCRFCFLPLLDRIWRLYPLLRLILPVPVTRNRLAAALLVFILGTFYSSKINSCSGLCLRCQQHRHVASFQTRLDIDLGDVLHLHNHALEHLSAQFRMGNFSAAEENRDFDSLPFADELANVAYFMLDVVSIGARTHFNFFDFHDRRLFAAMRALLLLVAKFAVIHHPANRRLGIGRDFDQVHFQRVHLLERFVQRQHTELLALGSDHPDFTGAYLMFDPHFYASPISCATSARKRALNSASGTGGKFSPPRRRGATVPAATSLSPITIA